MMVHAQSPEMVQVQMRLAFAGKAGQKVPPAVLWLKPLQQIPSTSNQPHERYTLMQQNRMFRPHLLVVPVGSVVLFPNADPYFHNVFSLFDGKRFDLGLYEAGSTREVTFSREGVSYIFCNIHPEMSAVVLALSTPFHAIADAHGAFHLRDVPAGDYELHVWVEGAQEPVLEHLTRRIHLSANSGDLGELIIPAITQRPTDHLNKFGQPYDRNANPTY
jgi:plastocyanin